MKEQQFDLLLEKLKYNMINLHNKKEKEYLNVKTSFIFKDPIKIIDKKKNNYINILSKLETLSPLQTIKRGYAVVRKDNRVISSKDDVNKKDKLELELKDGNINVEVI